mmetsp:Transcript_24833/g.36390  ORF Transcript_24833/g.36390 Transcript_24833/m.36390 type:complete len:105 (-) Transcript_24833:338-652(-)
MSIVAPDCSRNSTTVPLSNGHQDSNKETMKASRKRRATAGILLLVQQGLGKKAIVRLLTAWMDDWGQEQMPQPLTQLQPEPYCKIIPEPRELHFNLEKARRLNQ